MKVGITCGDPAGIGPEIVGAALESSLLPSAVEYLVIGVSEAFAPGKPGLASARHAIEALEESVALAKSGEIQAVVTGPVSKNGCTTRALPFPAKQSSLPPVAG